MPISLPNGLPAASALAAEGVAVVGGAALHDGGARPLRICLVNLMPKKTATETQICRLLGATAIPVEVTLCVPDSYQSRSTPESHIAAFYRRWSQIRGEHFDGMVMTGAPIETLPFEAVDYWTDLCAMLEWARARVAASFYICWAAQAALYHFRGVPKHERAAKLSGVYRQRVMRADSRLLQGFGDEFPVPVSRYTEVRAADLPRGGERARAVGGDRACAWSRTAPTARPACSTTWNTIPKPCATNSCATASPASSPRSRPTISRTTIPRARRRTCGGHGRISCSATGWRRSRAPRRGTVAAIRAALLSSSRRAGPVR